MSESRSGRISFATIGDTISKVGSGTWQGVPTGKPPGSGLGDTRWAGYTHAAMWDMLMRAQPDEMFEQAREWDRLRHRVQQLNDSVQQKLAAAFGTWRGSAAAGMANSGSTLLSWANEASQTTGSVATQLESYTNALVRARHAMPPPPKTSVRKWYRDADTDDKQGPEGAFLLHRLSMDQAANAAKEREAKHEAMRVMQDFESHSADIHRSVGTFRTAPAITTTGGRPDPAPVLTNPHPPVRPHPVPAPQPLPGPQPHPAPLPDPSGDGGSHSPGIGTTTSSSFDPYQGSGGYGAGGSGGYGATGGGFGAGGDAVSAGNRFGSGAFGPGASAGAATGGSVGAGGLPGSGGVIGESAAAARGGGAAGGNGMFPAGMGGRGDRENEHKRSRYLVGEDLFDDDRPLPPAVLDAGQREQPES